MHNIGMSQKVPYVYTMTNKRSRTLDTGVTSDLRNEFTEKETNLIEEMEPDRKDVADNLQNDAQDAGLLRLRSRKDDRWKEWYFLGVTQKVPQGLAEEDVWT